MKRARTKKLGETLMLHTRFCPDCLENDKKEIDLEMVITDIGNDMESVVFYCNECSYRTEEVRENLVIVPMECDNHT